MYEEAAKKKSQILYNDKLTEKERSTLQSEIYDMMKKTDPMEAERKLFKDRLETFQVQSQPLRESYNEIKSMDAE